MKKTVTHLTLILFILLSCAKDGKRIFVEGKVLNPNTGEGIEGATIKIMKNALSGGYKVLKEYKTGADGTFEIGVNSIAIDVYVKCDDGFGNYNIGWDLDFEADIIDLSTFRIPKKGKVYKADYHTVPTCSYSIEIENINCEGATDSMYFQQRNQFEEYSNYSSPRIGCYYANTSSSPNTIESGYRYFKIYVNRPSGQTVIYDTIYLEPNILNHYHMKY